MLRRMIRQNMLTLPREAQAHSNSFSVDDDARFDGTWYFGTRAGGMCIIAPPWKTEFFHMEFSPHRFSHIGFSRTLRNTHFTPRIRTVNRFTNTSEN